MQYFSFFHFGCWNVDGCKPNNSNEISKTKKIIDAIKEHGNYKFGIIAGDNIYQTKKRTNYKNSKNNKKHKKHLLQKLQHRVIDINVLENGIRCVKSIGEDSLEKTGNDIPIYPVLGNHDIYPEKYIININDANNKNVNMCHHMEMQMTDSWQKNNMYNWTYENSYFVAIDTNILSIISSENRALQVIRDALSTLKANDDNYIKWEKKLINYEMFHYENAYTRELADDIKEIADELNLNTNIFVERRSKCYRNLHIQEFINIVQTRKFLKKCFKESETYDNLFIVGHYPIFSYKNERDEMYDNNFEMIEFMFDDDLLKYYSNTVNDNPKNIYYLCADTHNFQYLELFITYNNIKYKIIQVVAGTGGARPDPIPIFPKNAPLIHNVSKFMTVKRINIQPSYGYAEITVADKVNIEYKHVIKDPHLPTYNINITDSDILIGGHNCQQKYIVNKNNYMNLKIIR